MGDRSVVSDADMSAGRAKYQRHEALALYKQRFISLHNAWQVLTGHGRHLYNFVHATQLHM